MARKRIFLEVMENVECPLFRKGDKMVLTLPGVDMEASTDICTLALSSFLPVHDQVDCGELRVQVNTIRFKCPRPHNPVTFDVWEVDEDRGRTAMVQRIAGDVQKSVEALKSIPVFRLLSAGALRRLLLNLRIETHRDGDLLVEQGQVGQALYIVYRGQVEVLAPRESSSGSRRVLATLGVKNCFGEMSLLSGTPATADVRARGEISLLVIEKRDFERLLRENPIMSSLFTRLLSERLQATSTQVAEVGEQEFSGKLSVLGLAEVVQALSESRRSGTMVVRGPDGQGRIGFREGRIYEIALGETEGAEAFYHMLGWAEGEFWLETREVPETDRIACDVIGLLLEGMRRIDERNAATS